MRPAPVLAATLVPTLAAALFMTSALPATLSGQEPAPARYAFQAAPSARAPAAQASSAAGPASEVEGGVPAAPPPAPGSLFLVPERFEREDGSLGHVDRGTLFVPVNRSEPSAGVLGIDVWRFRGAQGTEGRPPLVYLNGGPGWPGLDRALERKGFFEREIEPFLQVGDIVLVGQRGIGSSRPNTACEAPPPSPEAATGARPSRAELDRASREAADRCRRWWRERGLDLSGFSVLEAAADVDAVRQALGYERITIWGASFGSHWGMAVLRQHPEIVERALLTGMEGPDHTYDSPEGVLNALTRMAADAEDAPALRERVPDGGFVAALRRAIERLDREPVRVTVPRRDGEDSVEVTLDGDAARRLSDGYLGRVGERRWEASWPAGILLLDRGEYQRAARELAPPAEPSGGGFWPTASYFMLDCGSGITPEREARLLDDPARHVVGEQNRWYRAVCPAWGADLGDDFRRMQDIDVPTVIVHGTWDLSTPLENALELVPHFRDGTFVRVERGSHGALGEALEHVEGFRESLVRFLSTGDRTGIPGTVELPEPDWVTPADLAPEELSPEAGEEG